MFQLHTPLLNFRFESLKTTSCRGKILQQKMLHHTRMKVNSLNFLFSLQQFHLQVAFMKILQFFFCCFCCCCCCIREGVNLLQLLFFFHSSWWVVQRQSGYIKFVILLLLFITIYMQFFFYIILFEYFLGRISFFFFKGGNGIVCLWVIGLIDNFCVDQTEKIYLLFVLF